MQYNFLTQTSDSRSVLDIYGNLIPLSQSGPAFGSDFSFVEYTRLLLALVNFSQSCAITLLKYNFLYFFFARYGGLQVTSMRTELLDYHCLNLLQWMRLIAEFKIIIRYTVYT